MFVSFGLIESIRFLVLQDVIPWIIYVGNWKVGSKSVLFFVKYLTTKTFIALMISHDSATPVNNGSICMKVGQTITFFKIEIELDTRSS